MRLLLDTPNIKMQEILEIEREMARLRGEIERIKGEQRFLRDRVSLATIDIRLSREAGVELSPTAKIYPGLRLSSLILLRPGNRERLRLGGGGVVHLGIPRVTLELDAFATADGETDPSFIATFGGSMYSDFLGRGKRKMFNPYVGLRAGYAYLDGSHFTAATDVGVELYKTKHVMLDANVRTHVFVGESADVAIVPSLSAVFAF